MKFSIIVFPGSNCDQDMKWALEKFTKEEVKMIMHTETALGDADAVIIPGGFSFGDYLRAGAIASLTPVMTAVRGFAEKGGFILGICNGFQILCEAGLLPGNLLPNENARFSCKNTFIKVENSQTFLSCETKENDILNIPVAHKEGRYYASPARLAAMNKKNQIVFRYCNESGNTDSASNPSGALENIAGICNERKNIFGMMPHPERAVDIELGSDDGTLVFQSMIKFLATKSFTKL